MSNLLTNVITDLVNEYSDAMNTVYLLLPSLISIMRSLHEDFQSVENLSCTFWDFLPNSRHP